jgi:predicted Zn-dependent peptidase
MDSMGAFVSAGANHDYSETSCHSADPDFPKALEMMAEALFQPAFSLDEIEKERAAHISGIRSRKENIFSVAMEVFNSELYGQHPYGVPSSGNEESVNKITQKDLIDWHAKLIQPKGSILVIASKSSFASLCKLVDRCMGPHVWKNTFRFNPLKMAKPMLKFKNIRRKEKFEQAYLLLGFPAPSYDSPDYFSIKLLNACLGGGMSTRLFQELREKQGLAYDVGSFYASRKAGSAFVVYLGLQESRIKQAKKQIELLLKDVLEKGIQEEEINQVKSYLNGVYLLDHQTNSQRAHYLGWWHVLGKGIQFDSQYTKVLNKTTPEMLNKVAKHIFKQKPLVVEIIPAKKNSRTTALSNE